MFLSMDLYTGIRNMDLYTGIRKYMAIFDRLSFQDSLASPESPKIKTEQRAARPPLLCF